jgi:DNA repair protein RecO (recombination protein O)
MEDHLGTFVVEAATLRTAALMDNGAALQAMGWIAALIRLLPERDPHPDIYRQACALADQLADRRLMPVALVRFELAMLASLGFGLDLRVCALTGTREDLAYVSPRSGRAVSRAAAAPWKERLLPLPAFLHEVYDQDQTQDSAEHGNAVRAGEAAISATDLRAAFALTGHFLARRIFAPRGMEMPQARALCLSMIAGAGAGA